MRKDGRCDPAPPVGGAIVFADAAPPDVAIDRLIANRPDHYARDADDTLRITPDLADGEDVIRAAQEILMRLGARRAERCAARAASANAGTHKRKAARRPPCR